MSGRKAVRSGAARAGREFAKLVEVQQRLRAPRGCPWDREQSHQSLKPFLLEETYEVLEALDSGDDRKLVSELGDLLLQVVFHAQLAAETKRFDAADVARAIREKLVRRHPHVFATGRARTSAEVLKRWEELKAEERRAEGEPERQSVLDGVNRNLPALAEAFQISRRAASVGFDWKNLDGVAKKIEEELGELRRAARRAGKRGKTRAGARQPHEQRNVEEEAGDLLFAAANVARFLGLDPEIALKKANRKFERRFRHIEQQAGRNGYRLEELQMEELDKLWNRAKRLRRK